MLQILNVSIWYNETVDRLVLRLGGPNGGMLDIQLTRRITRRLLIAFVDLLTRSSAMLPKVPSDHRLEAIAIEHLGAVGRPKRQTACHQQDSPTGAGSTAEAVLAMSVNVETFPDYFVLRIRGAKEVVAEARLSRSEFHQLLGALDHYSERAEWNLRGESGWLAQAHQVALETHGTNLA